MTTKTDAQDAGQEIKKDADVKKALEQAAPKPPPRPPTSPGQEKVRLGGYAIALLVLAGLYFAMRSGAFEISDKVAPLLHRGVTAAFFVILILGLTKLLEVLLIARIGNAVSRYNLKRILRLLSVLVVGFIIVSFLFVNWYTAVVSVGIVSLILGFALQTPITSLIGWIYILVREPYRVGDRIRIGDATGDVIDVSYLDTTLWEFGGEYLSTDHPSGRVIKFPNSTVLNSPVYNYSWPLFPYIWNEIKFQVAYESDLEFVAKVMHQIAEEELGQVMVERVKVFRELLAKTPVDELEVREHPAVQFRVSENTWIEAIVRYLVHPKEAGRTKTRMIKKMLATLNAQPDRVLFPKGNMR